MKLTLFIILVLFCIGSNYGNVVVAPQDSGIADSWIVVLKDHSYFRVLGASQVAMEHLDASDSDVAWIEQEVRFKPTNVQCTGASLWGLDRIDMADDGNDDGNYTYTQDGSGVTIYILDSGIRLSHQDFEGRASFGFDAFSEGPGDPFGHGTHVAGSAAGRTYGTAKKANLISVRVIDEYGSGTTNTVLDGLVWVRDNAVQPAVVSMSIISSATAIVNDYINILSSMNITVVAAAGNTNQDACAFSPVSAATAIGVGATDFFNQRAMFPNGGGSNYGSCVDMFAPGTGILSAGHQSDTSSLFASGTSMACPYVSGLAALLLGHDPTLTPQQVQNQLESFATPDLILNPANSANLLVQTPFPDSSGASCSEAGGGSGGASSSSSRIRSLLYYYL